MNALRIKRVCRAPRTSEGTRILVDRVWPRGMTRDRLRIAEWSKDIAPSANLRRSFNHDPAKWDGFRKSYFRELADKRSLVSRLLRLLEEGAVTLVYGARDETLNTAAALKHNIEGERGKHNHFASSMHTGRPMHLTRAAAKGECR
ncbi:DUF488 domain-containing protein [Roseibium aggregatum]|uniref:DUF488 family protein n=1 Tax=Roseibium aggregatum TaxID=187304 RepID=A0A926P0L5_9HYPH|nr:DUF488 family protein [Roseibium aggregatum]MBD1547756.1 DUF488 family protein [Roseibium aggregatum]